MGEHIMGFVKIDIVSANSNPPGDVKKVVITITGELKPEAKEQFLTAIKKAGTDLGLDVQTM